MNAVVFLMPTYDFLLIFFKDSKSLEFKVLWSAVSMKPVPPNISHMPLILLAKFVSIFKWIQSPKAIFPPFLTYLNVTYVLNVSNVIN
jgi:hypothetical protein